jgi:hypothetical protein
VRDADDDTLEGDWSIDWHQWYHSPHDLCRGQFDWGTIFTGLWPQAEWHEDEDAPAYGIVACDHDWHALKRTAMTSHQYGRGQTIYAGFDWLMQATAEPESVLANALRNAIAQVQPSELAAAAGDVAGFDINIINDSVATPAQLEMQLPASVLVDAPYFENPAQGEWHWQQDTSVGSITTLPVYVRLDDAATEEISLQLNSTRDDRIHQQAAVTVPLQAQQSAGTLAEAIDQAHTLKHTYVLDLRYTAVYLKLLYVESRIARGELQRAYKALIMASNTLLWDNTEGVIELRLAIDEQLKLLARQLN